MFDANNVAFYANGALLGSTTLATLPEHGTLGLRIGGLTGGHGTFNGDMDEIRYIGKARSAAWAAAEYRTMAAPEEFLYANYGVTDVLNVKVFEKCVPIRLAGYEGTSTLTNFPVLVRISEALIPGFSYAETKGLGGVRFTDGNLNLLTFECEEWNEAGESRFWVSVPELSGTETMIRFYYGKREGKRQGGAENAWKTWTKAGFAGVFHMDVSSGYAIRDTVNGAIGTVVAPTNSMPGAAGLVGGAYQNPVWHTGDRGIKLAPDENGYGVIRSALTNAAVCTFSAWVKNEGGAGNGKDPNYGHIFHQDRYGVKTATEAGDRWNNRFEACLEGSSTKFTIRDYGGEFGNKSCASLAGDWHLFVLSYAGSKRRVYVDGEEMMALASDAAGYVPSETYNFLIGKNGDGTGGGAANAQWVGGIDEVRFRTDATATDWMKAEVANVKAGTLLSYGSAQKSAPSFVLYLK